MEMSVHVLLQRDRPSKIQRWMDTNMLSPNLNVLLCTGCSGNYLWKQQFMEIMTKSLSYEILRNKYDAI